jgi:hypothetical protein
MRSANFIFFFKMAFGKLGKWLRGAVDTVVNTVNQGAKKLGTAVNSATTALKPIANMATTAISAVNPALGQAIDTGFNLVHNISRGAKDGGIAGGIAGGVGSILNGRAVNSSFAQEDEYD